MSAQTASLIRSTRSKPHRAVRTWPLMAPAVGVVGDLVSRTALMLTLWYAFQNYNLQTPPAEFSGLANFRYLVTDPDLLVVIRNTLELVFVPMAITIVFGVFFAVLYDGSIPGAQCRSSSHDYPFLCHAARRGADLEKPNSQSSVGSQRLAAQVGGTSTYRLVRHLSYGGNHYHRVLGLDALRYLDSC